MKKLITCLSFLFAAGVACGQSYHFSQFFSTPLLTNPANTGLLDGPYRLASNFRSQGNPGGNPFLTGYLSGDISPFRNYLPVNHKAGVGLYAMNDRSLGSVVQTNSVGMSLAYHVGLDPNNEQSVGVGFQGTFNQRRIDYSKLTFENQYGPTGWNPNQGIGEPLDYNSKSFFDVNAGIIYHANLEDKSFFAGISVYNILQHKENLLVEDFKMPTRISLQGGAQFFIGEYAKIYTSLTSMSQANANETTIGGAYGLQLGDGAKNELTGGLWYRVGDALIPYLGYQRDGFQAGLSYDYTVSGMKTGSQIRNGYELTLLYKGLDKRQLKMLIPWY
jgi:type IX secretion system PorP/SprF family membrane protein